MVSSLSNSTAKRAQSNCGLPPPPTLSLDMAAAGKPVVTLGIKTCRNPQSFSDLIQFYKYICCITVKDQAPMGGYIHLPYMHAWLYCKNMCGLYNACDYYSCVPSFNFYIASFNLGPWPHDRTSGCQPCPKWLPAAAMHREAKKNNADHGKRETGQGKPMVRMISIYHGREFTSKGKTTPLKSRMIGGCMNECSPDEGY